jgi:hypothetical protein
VNYCYDIKELYDANRDMMQLTRWKAMYKIHLRNYLKQSKLSKQDLRNAQVPPLKVSGGLCKTKFITLEEINKGLRDVEQKMINFEKNLAVDTHKDLYLGMAFIVLQTQKDRITMDALQDDSLIARFFRWLSKTFCGCCRDKDDVTAISHAFERAPEPTDVYWDNLSVSWFSRSMRILMTYFFTIILVGICFGIIYGITISKADILERSR